MLLPGAGVVFCAMLFLQSCSKSASKDFQPASSATTPDRIISAKIATGESYSIGIDNVGQLSISHQAANFLTSQTTTDPKSGMLLYQYTPAAGFKGNDEVVLAHKTEYIYGSNSSCGYGSNSAIGSRTSYIAIRLNVGQ